MEHQSLVEKILTNDQFVKEQIEKILIYFNLKHAVRYSQSREGAVQAESVAEHVYAMHVLCDYFLPLHTDILNYEVVRKLITWHDMAEAVVGDMSAELKTEAHKKAEREAERDLVESAPPQLRSEMEKAFKDYHSLESKESQFVRALDKLEPLFHLVLLSRKKDFLAFKIEWTIEEDKEYRGKSIKKFPLLQRFDDMISIELDTLPYYRENR